MKFKHWIMVALVVIGALYVFHTATGRASFGSFRSGLGLGK